MRHLLSTVAFYSLPLILLLCACSPSTPLFVMQVTAGEAVEYKQMKSNRLTAAIEEEGDLLTYSLEAIRNNRSPEAERLFLIIFEDRRYSDEIRAIALYQIALIYMNRYNDQRDDDKAGRYLQQIVAAFPQSHVANRAETRLFLLRQRSNEPVQKTARELLAEWTPRHTIDLDKSTLDSDLNMLSRRAILKNRTPEAERLYLLLAEDPAVDSTITEMALYQIALIYLSADNPARDRDKAAEYLRRILAEYPHGQLNDAVHRHLDTVLNMQP